MNHTPMFSIGWWTSRNSNPGGKILSAIYFVVNVACFLLVILFAGYFDLLVYPIALSLIGGVFAGAVMSWNANKGDPEELTGELLFILSAILMIALIVLVQTGIG